LNRIQNKPQGRIPGPSALRPMNTAPQIADSNADSSLRGQIQPDSPAIKTVFPRAQEKASPPADAILPRKTPESAPVSAPPNSQSRAKSQDRPSGPGSQEPDSSWLDFMFKNVVGIVGALAVLIGIIYLGYLGIFNLPNEARAGGLALLGFGLSASYFIVRKNKSLGNLGQWLKGIGGAVILLAAVGSIGIPGLQWVNDPFTGLLITLLAIAANVTLAWLSDEKYMVPVHGFFCFVALVSGEATFIPLIIAISLTLLLGLLSYLKKNPIALLTNAFFGLAYFVIWYLRFDDPDSTAALGLFLHFGFLHLLWILLFTPKFQALQKWSGYKALSFFAAIALVIGMLVFNHEPRNYTLLLFLSAGLFTGGYFLQRKGLQDFFLKFYSIMGFGSTSLAILSFLFWSVDVSLVFLCIAVLGILWTIGSENKVLPEDLSPLGVLTEGIGWLILVGHLLYTTSEIGFLQAIGPRHFLLLLPLASSLFHGLRKTKAAYRFSARVTGWISSLTLFVLTMMVSAEVSAPHHQWFTLAFLLAGLGTFALSEKKFIYGPSIVFHLSLIGVLLSYLIQGEAWQWDFTGIWSTLAMGFGLFLLFFPQRTPENTDLSFLGPLWLGLGSLGLPFFLFSRNIPYLVGPMWILGFLLLTGLHLRIDTHGKTPDARSLRLRTWKTMAVVHLILFWVHHFLVVAQSGSVLAYAPFGGGFSITISHHLVSGVMGLLVLLWAWIFPVWKKPDNLRPINFLLPFALALAAILLIEFRTDNLALSFALTSLGLNLAGNHLQAFGRLRAYSLWFYWISLALLASLTSSLRFPDIGLAAPRLIQIILTIGTQVGMIVLFFRGKEIEANTDAKEKYQKFYGFIIRQKNKLVLLPIFFALGFYLYWALDGTTLTLGWVLGGLVLFILGLWIKEKLFHYLSLVTVGATLLKLVFVDMADSGDLYKVLVLIISGVVLITMSVLYGRFQPTKASDPAALHPKGPTIESSQGDKDE
jgi:hypothetical protein